MPTQLGWGTLGAGALLLAGADALAFPELAVLGAAALLAALLGVVWTLPRPSVEISREITPRQVSRGDTAICVLTVVNTGRRTRRRLEAVESYGSETVPVRLPRLRPDERRTVSYRLPTQRRGEIPVGPLWVTRSDPLRMVRRRHRCGSVESMLVWPRVTTLPMIAFGRTQHLEGTTSDTAPSGTVTFHTLREYVPGDDQRHIHWRSTARTGRLMVRHLVDASRPQTTLVLDTDPAAYGENAIDHFENAVDAVASVAMASARQSFPVRIVTTGGPGLATKGSPRDARVLLDWLSRVQLDAVPSSLAATLEGLRRARGAGLLAVVTGALDSPALAGLATLKRGFDRAMVISVSPIRATVEARTMGMGALDASSAEALVMGWHREGRR